jgi:chemotaxis protein methyltransferase CheR
MELLMTAELFKKFRKLIIDNLGFYFPESKKNLLLARLAKRITKLEMGSICEYEEYLFKNDSELTHFLNLITTNKTSFYREREHFNWIKEYLLPTYFSQGKDIFKIWCAGCSSGQEAYSLTMEMLNFKKNNKGFDFRIYATDVNTEMLGKAREGVYPIKLSSEIPLIRRSEYLLKGTFGKKDYFKFNEKVTSKIKFSYCNLLDLQKYSNNTFDLIMCRNVLIYFPRAIQSKIINNFNKYIALNGYLVIGHSESLPKDIIYLDSLKSGVHKILSY